MRCIFILDQKDFFWIWIAVDQYGKRIINFFVGDRSNKAAKEFWETMKQHQMGRVTSDFWKAYESIIPKEKHIQIKAGTFTVEGYDSLFRHFLARMRRKTKCYSKKMEMLKLSVLLLMHHRNGTLSILD